MPENDEITEIVAVDEAVETVETEITDVVEVDEAAEPTVTFADLGLPEGVVRKLAQNGVSTPFPIQAATIPDALVSKDILGAAAPAPARPSPSVCRPWRGWPTATPRRRSPARSS